MENPPVLINQEAMQISMPTDNVFLNKESFEHAQRVAKMLSQSDLVPVTFKGKIENCLIALNMAGRIGADPLMVMQNLYIVHGKPAWSSTFLIATLNASGRFSPLRYEENKNGGGSCRAIATDLRSGEKCEGIWVDMLMAKAEGWSEKTGSKWKTMPQLMRRYRAATFFTRQFAPEISMGIHTQDEVEDIGYTMVSSKQTAVKQTPEEIQVDRITQMVNDCLSWEELQELQINNPDIDAEMIKRRNAELEKQ